MKQIRCFLIIVTILSSLMILGCQNTSELQNDTSITSSQNLEETVWVKDVSEICSLSEDAENIFYISDAGIMKHDKLQNTDMVLVKSKSINSFRIYGDTLYYLSLIHI